MIKTDIIIFPEAGYYRVQCKSQEAIDLVRKEINPDFDAKIVAIDLWYAKAMRKWFERKGLTVNLID